MAILLLSIIELFAISMAICYFLDWQIFIKRTEDRVKWWLANTISCVAAWSVILAISEFFAYLPEPLYGINYIGQILASQKTLTVWQLLTYIFCIYCLPIGVIIGWRAVLRVGWKNIGWVIRIYLIFVTVLTCVAFFPGLTIGAVVFLTAGLISINSIMPERKFMKILKRMHFSSGVGMLPIKNPIELLKAGRRVDIIKELENKQKKEPANYRITHSLALLYYWWALDKEEKGDTGNIDLTWKKAIANWVMLIHMDDFWNRWKEEKGNVYFEKIKDEDVKAAKEKIIEGLESCFRERMDRCREKKNVAGYNRYREYRTALSIEVRTAGLFEELRRFALERGEDLPYACGAIMLEQLEQAGHTKGMAECASRIVPQNKTLTRLINYLSPSYRIFYFLEEKMLIEALNELKNASHKNISISHELRILFNHTCEEWISNCVGQNAGDEIVGTMRRVLAVTKNRVLGKMLSERLCDRGITHINAELKKENNKDYSEGIKDLEEAFSFDRKNNRVIKGLAGAYNGWGVGLTNDGKHWKALRMFSKANKYDPSDKVIRNNIKMTRAAIFGNLPSGALIGMGLGSAVCILASFFHISVGIVGGFYCGGIALAIAFIVLPLWLLGSTDAYSFIVEILWQWFKGMPVLASLLALPVLPIAWVIFLFISLFGGNSPVDLKKSFTKSILSLGIGKIPIGWNYILYLWLILSGVSSLAFWAKNMLHLPGLLTGLVLAYLGGYTGLIVALMRFRYEETEEDVYDTDSNISFDMLNKLSSLGMGSNFLKIKSLLETYNAGGSINRGYGRRKVGTKKILKLSPLYPEAHLTYMFFGGLAAAGPWLWSKALSYSPVNILINSAVIGIIISVVTQFMLTKLCKNQ